MRCPHIAEADAMGGCVRLPDTIAFGHAIHNMLYRI